MYLSTDVKGLDVVVYPIDGTMKSITYSDEKLRVMPMIFVFVLLRRKRQKKREEFVDLVFPPGNLGTAILYRYFLKRVNDVMFQHIKSGTVVLEYHGCLPIRHILSD